jgi:hypothetical protein
MAMTGQETATEAEVGKGIRGKLVEDLKAVVADAEELLKATASQTMCGLIPGRPWESPRGLASPSASWPHSLGSPL